MEITPANDQYTVHETLQDVQHAPVETSPLPPFLSFFHGRPNSQTLHLYFKNSKQSFSVKTKEPLPHE